MLVHALYSIGTGTAVAVEAGSGHVCILRADNTTTATAAAATNSGEILCWGWNTVGQLVSSVSLNRTMHARTASSVLQVVHKVCFCVYHSFMHHRLLCTHCIGLTHCICVAVVILLRKQGYGNTDNVGDTPTTVCIML
jgi:Regulator of chromosome condensation (RCC1) repeat